MNDKRITIIGVGTITIVDDYVRVGNNVMIASGLPIWIEFDANGLLLSVDASHAKA